MKDVILVVGVDPGKATGIAVWDRQQSKFLQREEMGPEDTADWIHDLAVCWPAGTILFVVERFIITSGTAKVGREEEHWSMELIGWTRHTARRSGHHLLLQSAADGKKFAKDASLRAAGTWVKGKGHANDATRHVHLALAATYDEPPPWV